MKETVMKKINSNSVKFDKENEILNESLTPEKSDNKENNSNKNEELVDNLNKNEENKNKLKNEKI